MYNKKIFRNLSLLSALIIAVVIVSAQVGKQTGNKSVKETVDTDTVVNKVPPPDNTEGLAELNRIIDRYKDANFLLTGEINYYENIDSSDKPQERAKFTSVNTSWSSSYEIDSVQTIIQDGITLIIDKKEKTMSVMEQASGPEDVSVKKDVAAELSQFIDYIYSIQMVANAADKKLVIAFKDDAPFNMNKYEVVYNPDTYRVLRIRMEMTDGDISEMPGDSTQEKDAKDELVFVDSANNEISTGYYANLRTNAYEIIYKSERTVEPGIVDIDKFIKKDVNDGYVPAGPFKHYELLN